MIRDVPKLLPLILALLGCERSSPDDQPASTIALSGGVFRLGSDSAERALGYELAPDAVRRAGWYDAWEADPYRAHIGAFWLDRTPVTHRAYAAFVAATGARRPHISEADYVRQGFLVHAYTEVLPFLWTNDAPDPAMLDHPVVLVSRDDAAAYCEWRGARLPTEHEWEAACRGTDGRTFPWGSAWQPDVAHIDTTFTAPVLAHPYAATPDGVLDLVGNVFEWTSSDFGENLATLKGCSWDDAPGTCRCAFRHGRPPNSRHILIGFRCLRTVE